MRNLIAACAVAFAAVSPAAAQTPPSSFEAARYEGLHKAAHTGDMAALERLIGEGADIEARDGSGRTPLHVAAFASREDVVRALAAAGADMNALDRDAYDAVTIAAVADDVEMLQVALELGNSASNVTSPYDGTALIAAAHLGHKEVVRTLVEAGAPLDHVNNLGWTALLEVVILGDGGPDHVESLRHLLEGGADRAIADPGGVTPLEHARRRGYADMVGLLEAE
ncbi:MAG: ankyrin repeat domain-containing protein [Rhodobiaceae bacterium]|nr:ankyrin repeat domain-containing protein [Rhodobiaceae bacterium]MCC0017335.1 ankyrin repeat domain-containing protein [Rhodobiaceae bacterium]MCC0041075.1 ankyrin repeat domain-containing protein [Rhodobiaceae bacterium]